MVYLLVFIACLLFLLVGCGSVESEPEKDYWPERVEKPVPADPPPIQKPSKNAGDL